MMNCGEIMLANTLQEELICICDMEYTFFVIFPGFWPLPAGFCCRRALVRCVFYTIAEHLAYCS